MAFLVALLVVGSIAAVVLTVALALGSRNIDMTNLEPGRRRKDRSGDGSRKG